MPEHVCIICGNIGPTRRCPTHKPKRGPSSIESSDPTYRRNRPKVLARDGHRCRYCGAHATEVDHITPVAHGGTSNLDNLAAACQPCNRSKGAQGAGWTPFTPGEGAARGLAVKKTGVQHRGFGGVR